ncbi:lytic polysaccharide monooxygenase [Lentithecium fluviatile CBS 122367]|uniref:lytic cellulose monooxygenase (C4-dehydrogenating) n=1 Tax=Lentithecium fluviatile CBS 122367 TaxID=1168545 RepID=A0A6G1J2W1_9PLEO|nr:lytic polysaccharide monooxygenase [Lentithecium fluviatile CBS 122367]
MMFKTSIALAAIAAASQVADAHFTFFRIAHNGQWEAPFRYMRNKTSPYEERFSLPGHGFTTRDYNYATVYPDYPESVRCGRDNIKHALDTEVLDVQAGDALEFAHTRDEPSEWTDATFNCSSGYGACYEGQVGMDYNHWGPLIVHLSKVPEGQDIHTYDGSGEWIKIYTLGLVWRPDGASPVDWVLYNGGRIPGSRYSFRIPRQTPGGQYLIRVAFVDTGLKGSPYLTQYAHLYPSCFQLSVQNDGTAGALPKGVKIPEVMSPDSPGMQMSQGMHDSRKVDEGYVYPGGDLWDGEKLVVDKPDLTPVPCEVESGC